MDDVVGGVAKAVKLRALQRVWDNLGRKDPLWAILTAAEKRGNKWALDEFLETGRNAIAGLLNHLQDLGLNPPRHRALDFGCGVGRLTQPLAQYFDEVWGVDIAPSMIELARQYNQQGENCNFHLNETDDLAFFADESFGFVLSLITLQHIRSEHAARYIREFVRVLAPGGVTIFQMAGERTVRGWRRLLPERLARICRRLKHRHAIEMHDLPRAEVVRLLEESGARVVVVIEDEAAGAGWTSFRYCAVKEKSAH